MPDRYRVTRKRIVRGRTWGDDAATFEAGDVFAPTDNELAAFDDRLERVEPPTCDVVKQDGEVCGRELPCPYHSED